MPNINSLEMVEKIYIEFSGIEPGFNLDRIFQLWKLLYEKDKSKTSDVKFTSSELAEALSFSNTDVVRGIIKFLKNLDLIEDLNQETSPILSRITEKGSFWLNLVKDNREKFCIFLNQKVSELASIKVIISYIQKSMPSGVEFQKIETKLGDEIQKFWKLYPKYPTWRGQPVRKPFNEAILGDILDLLVDVMIIEKKDDKYYGPLF